MYVSSRRISGNYFANTGCITHSVPAEFIYAKRPHVTCRGGVIWHALLVFTFFALPAYRFTGPTCGNLAIISTESRGADANVRIKLVKTCAPVLARVASAVCWAICNWCALAIQTAAALTASTVLEEVVRTNTFNTDVAPTILVNTQKFKIVTNLASHPAPGRGDANSDRV